MNGWVKGLHPSAQHLRGLRDGGNIPDTNKIMSGRASKPTGTHSISIPASLIVFAVPPLPSNLNPSSSSPRAKGTSPFFSYTERRAGESTRDHRSLYSLTYWRLTGHCCGQRRLQPVENSKLIVCPRKRHPGSRPGLSRDEPNPSQTSTHCTLFDAVKRLKPASFARLPFSPIKGFQNGH